MSVYIPETNSTLAGTLACKFTAPAGSSYKPASAGFVGMAWIKTPEVGYYGSDPNLNLNIFGRGARQAALELNAAFPGIPISLTNIGVSGRPMDDFIGTGSYTAIYKDNWAKVKATLGVKQPYYMGFYGHSTISNNPTSAQYETVMYDCRAYGESVMGTALKLILCPTSRYANGNAQGGYSPSNTVRTAMRDYTINRPGTAFVAGNFSTIKNDTNDTGPHASSALTVGQGRSGSYLAHAVMSVCRAIKQQPLELVNVTPSGTTVRLKFAPTNPL